MRTLPDWITLRMLLASIDLGSIARAGERCGIATAAAAKWMQVVYLALPFPLEIEVVQ